MNTKWPWGPELASLWDSVGTSPHFNHRYPSSLCRFPRPAITCQDDAGEISKNKSCEAGKDPLLPLGTEMRLRYGQQKILLAQRSQAPKFPLAQSLILSLCPEPFHSRNFLLALRGCFPGADTYFIRSICNSDLFATSDLFAIHVHVVTAEREQVEALGCAEGHNLFAL